MSSNFFGVSSIIAIRDFLWPVYFMAMVLYLPSIFGLKLLMSSKTKKFKEELLETLKYPYVFWTSSLSLFSLFGTYYTGRHYFFLKYDCSITQDTTGYWITLFLLSKLPELLDTYFLILRSKPLTVLHWYHHLATMYIAFSGLYSFNREALLASWTNFFVHTVMYAYYAIYNVGFRKIGKYGIIVTFLQFLQMIFVLVHAFLGRNETEVCIPGHSNFYTNMVPVYFCVYITYGVLFFHLIYEKLFVRY
jgi:hypothetical protein